MLKLIKALDLQHWADTKESEALHPRGSNALGFSTCQITKRKLTKQPNCY